MNNIFSFKRFGLLFKKHTAENLRSYALSLFVLVGIMSLILGFVNYKASKPMAVNEQAAYLLGFFIFGGTVFTSTIFANFGDKRQAIAAITLPASTFEKFLVGWVYSYLLFQIIFLVAFYGILAVVMQMGHWRDDQAELINISANGQFQGYFLFILYGFLHSVVMYGAIYFKKMHFIKTAFVFFILVFAIWFVNDQILKAIINQSVWNALPFTGVSFYSEISQKTAVATHKMEMHRVFLSGETFVWLRSLFSAVGVMFWFAAYYRLKEKRV